MEQLVRRVTEWIVFLLDKGIKVNAEKSQVIMGISCGNMIVNASCGSANHNNTNYVQFTVCKTWIHKQCSGVPGTCRW